jgi:hypothetical protein
MNVDIVSVSILMLNVTERYECGFILGDIFVFEIIERIQSIDIVCNERQ